MIWLGGVLKRARSNWGPVVFCDKEEDCFENGFYFSYEDYLIYSANETKSFVFDPTKFNGKSLKILPPFFSANAGPILVNYYINPQLLEDGQPLGISKRKSTSSRKNQATLMLNPTISNKGKRFTGRLVPSTGVSPASATGATMAAKFKFEILSNFKYLVEITNKNGNDTYVQADFTWIEERELL